MLNIKINNKIYNLVKFYQFKEKKNYQLNYNL